MSADNRLCYMEWMGQWHAWHGSCSADYFEPPSGAGVKIFATEKEANDYVWDEARRMCDNGHTLEGGVTFIGKMEQEGALDTAVGYLTERLNNLRKTGQQYPE